MNERELHNTFTQLMNTHKGIVNKIVYLYADSAEDREDLRQEMMFQAFRSFEKFEERSKFSTWLYRVCLNTALVFRRKSGRIETAPLDLAVREINDTDKHPGAELLYMAIKQLPEAEKSLIILHLDGYNNDEIAQITGITKNNAAVRLHRVKLQLTEKLKNAANRV